MSGTSCLPRLFAGRGPRNGRSRRMSKRTEALAEQTGVRIHPRKCLTSAVLAASSRPRAAPASRRTGSAGPSGGRRPRSLRSSIGLICRHRRDQFGETRRLAQLAERRSAAADRGICVARSTGSSGTPLPRSDQHQLAMVLPDRRRLALDDVDHAAYRAGRRETRASP